MDPIAVIGLLGQVYGAVVQAYDLIQTVVAFPETAANLVVKLEVERIRFELWGRNSGADSDALRPGLAPFEPLIVQILAKIQKLLYDSDTLKAKYGLSSSMDDVAGKNAARHKRVGSADVVELVRGVLRSAFAFTATDNGNRAANIVGQIKRKGLDRLSWAIVSKSRFEAFITDMRGFNNNLNELLQESQLLELSRQWQAIEMHAVTCSNNPEVLKTLQEATEGDENCREIFSMAKTKGIIVSDEVDEASRLAAWGTAGWQPERHSDEHSMNRMILSKKDFELPANFHELSRCIAVYRPHRSEASKGYVLIERKQELESSENKQHHKLIKLVNSFLSQNLLCQGYWSEAQYWYFVYQFPRQRIARAPNSSQPLSLHHLLTHPDIFHPPLELRLVLARALAASFLRFYGSKWLHKAVRSDNILFALSRTGGGLDLGHPIVVGFTEFARPLDSRLHSRRPFEAGESCHPVLGSLPPEAAIYYHPAYLDPRAERPYSMAFDIYSFGLVLLEVGWWLPLESIPGALQAGRLLDTSYLRREVIKKAKQNLAFAMGTPYKDAVEWCLTRDAGSDADLAVKFYGKVVVPLSNISP
ncbi:prion-inhibition and propagation-domain-containing protein [Mycena latifolia]|nr:prion-inhibition and propagation-domain-containing protein [Mycena latifolia]